MNTPRAAKVRSLVVNGGFDRGLLGWEGANARTVPRESGGQCLEVRGAGGARQDVFAKGLSGTFTVAVDVEASDIRARQPAGYAFAAVYQLRGDGQLAAFHDFVQIMRGAPWQRRSWTFRIAPGVEIISLRCGVFNAEGTARFDNWTLVGGPRAAELEEVMGPRSFTGAERGRVAVFREPGFPAGPGATKPERLAAIMRPAVESVEFLDADALADPAVLSPERFDLVILPYGENFPGTARTAFVQYLHGGGDFVSVGGYAFSTLYYREAGPGWVPEKTTWPKNSPRPWPRKTRCWSTVDSRGRKRAPHRRRTPAHRTPAGDATPRRAESYNPPHSRENGAPKSVVPGRKAGRKPNGKHNCP
ncbi:MAG: hypothetical protein GXP31_07105 [Kiritimatiellaeota bacterium]|nr:hypothetical protein [Kiritimatiellota bacterium]